MALRTHFTQTKIGCPGVAEFTVQRTKALFDHITGLRQISVTFGLRFRQRMFAVGFSHNAVQKLMFFQMLPVFLTVVAFAGRYILFHRELPPVSSSSFFILPISRCLPTPGITSRRPSMSNILSVLILPFVPFLGQVLDIRDLAACIYRMAMGKAV